MIQSYLLRSNNRDWLVEHTQSMYQSIHTIKQSWDSFVTNPDTHTIFDKKTISIDDIRSLITIASLRPYQEQSVWIIIENAHKMTIPAQNALLKLLEEPPGYVYLVLWTPLDTDLLATIRSRCAIFTDTTPQTFEDAAQWHTLIGQLAGASVGERLITIRKIIKDEHDGEQYIDQLLSYFQQIASQDHKQTAAIRIFLHELLALKILLTKQVTARFLCDIITMRIPQ